MWCWLADNLLVPVVAGIAVGVALRSAAIAAEVSAHDLRGEALATDLTRWVTDRGQMLDASIFNAINLARQGIIEDVAQMPPPPGTEGRPGDMSSSGAFNLRVGRIMRQALHEYRDEASQKTREYKAMARSEGWLHRLMRLWRRSGVPTPLAVTDYNLEVLESWRERQIPVFGEPTITVDNDPTKAENAADILPLESGGLSWKDAGRPSGKSG